MQKSIGKIELAGYSPGMPFPESRELQEGMYIKESYILVGNVTLSYYTVELDTLGMSVLCIVSLLWG